VLPCWISDFNGDGRAEVLFYCSDDDNWRIGSYDGTQLQWALAGSTVSFGHAIYDGRPFWAGDFNGDGRAEMLFYYPGDDNWWLGTYDGTQLQWTLVGNTANIGHAINDPTPYMDLEYWFFYPFNGDTSRFPGAWGEHVGDWEHIILRLEYDNENLHQVFYSAHSAGESAWQSGNTIGFVEATQHPIVYAARHSHANYTNSGVAGVHGRYFAANRTNKGHAWDTWNNVIGVEWSTLPTVNHQDWIVYTGRWGQTPHNSFGDSPNGPVPPPDFGRVTDGMLFSERSIPDTISVIYAGCRFQLPSAAALDQVDYDRTKVVPMPNSYLRAFPSSPPSLTQPPSAAIPATATFTLTRTGGCLPG
jgi:hypothetical protein